MWCVTTTSKKLIQIKKPLKLLKTDVFCLSQLIAQELQVLQLRQRCQCVGNAHGTGGNYKLSLKNYQKNQTINKSIKKQDIW